LNNVQDSEDVNLDAKKLTGAEVEYNDEMKNKNDENRSEHKNEYKSEPAIKKSTKIDDISDEEYSDEDISGEEMSDEEDKDGVKKNRSLF
jgi:hypothetical protein